MTRGPVPPGGPHPQQARPRNRKGPGAVSRPHTVSRRGFPDEVSAVEAKVRVRRKLMLAASCPARAALASRAAARRAHRRNRRRPVMTVVPNGSRTA